MVNGHHVFDDMIGVPLPDRHAHFIGGVYAGEFRIQAGMTVISHKHVYDHMSILASGTAIVECGGVEQQIVGPCIVEIKKGVRHSVRAVTDIAWFCIHAVDQASEAYKNQDADATDGLLIIK